MTKGAVPSWAATDTVEIPHIHRPIRFRMNIPRLNNG